MSSFLDQYAITFPPADSIQSPLLPGVEDVAEGSTHKVGFRPYGDYKTAKKIIITVHGLTGDTLNYHYFSEYFITKGYVVVNIDVMGRGFSGNKGVDKDGKEFVIPPQSYTCAQYVEDIFNLLCYLRKSNPDPDVKWFWVGTSMGGLLGTVMSAKYPQLHELGLKFNALFFNDIAPIVPWGEIDRIAKYVVVDTAMESPEKATEYYESLYKAHFGPKTDTRFFAHRALYALVYDKERDAYVVSYDRLGAAHGLVDLSCGSWIEHPTLGKCMSYKDFFHRLEAPLLVYRGETSVLLPPELLNDMKQTYDEKKIDFKSIVWPETGHTPPLYQVDEFEPILEWFEKY